MQTGTQVARESKGKLWAGRIMSGLVILFLLVDAIVKFLNIPAVAETFAQLGWPVALANTVGIILLVCTILYVIPRTSALGAVLLTGYFGGAIATHVRVGNPLFSHVLFPIYLAILMWGGLYARNSKVRELFSFSS
jgi:hypothetical protein